MFLSRKACITIKRITVRAKDIKKAPVKWEFKSKEEPDASINLKSRNLVKAYMQFSGVEYTYPFLTVYTYA